MTNAQKWVAAFLVLFVLLFMLSRLTKRDEPVVDELEYYGTEESRAAETALDGMTLINNAGCTSCHGVNLEGSMKAPSLYNVKEHWSRSKLIGYLRNPSSYKGGDRFDVYREKYKNVVMPSYSNIDVKDLGKIADYLLSLQEE